MSRHSNGVHPDPGIESSSPPRNSSNRSSRSSIVNEDTSTVDGDQTDTEAGRPRGDSNASSFSFASSVHNSDVFPNVPTPNQASSTAAETDAGPSQSSPPVSVSTDQERQILLLMLLAQVCALHDPTPRTFTVHVLELFERGILDRDSIHFLFDLGLVPALSPTRGLLTSSTTATTTTTTTTTTASRTPPSHVASNETQIALAGQQHYTHKLHLDPQHQQHQQQQQQQHRSQEASAIRTHLEQLERQRAASTTPTASGEKPWDVEYFPLSLSRYQREFTQIRLLNSGSFGQVFHATRNLDGCDYAIKKVTFDATGYSNKSIQQVVREVQCLASVNDHPNIVRYYTSWLEPSWMTGGSSTSSVGNHAQTLETPAIPKQRLLTDLQQLMQRPNGAPSLRGRNDSSNGYTDASSLFDPAGGSSAGPRHRRRWSFDSSVDSMHKEASEPTGATSWEDYHDWSLDNQDRRGSDDSYLPENHRRPQQAPRRTNNQNPSKSQQQPTSPLYRYQICLFIQMQLCHPATLADWIRERNRRISESDHASRIGPAWEIFQQIASGLAHVHEKGIIHRDLKPANIFASSDGKVIKIGDFGLSKQLMDATSTSSPRPATTMSPTSTTASSTAKTAPNPAGNNGTTKNCDQQQRQNVDCWQNTNDGAVIPLRPTQIVEYARTNSLIDPLTAGIGTASYASPEQVKSRNYGTKADIFSLGLILLELMCCFETEHERLHKFQQCRQQRLPGWLSEHYPEIANIILECTRLDPRQRPMAKELLLDGGTSPSNAHHPHHVELKRQLSEKEEQLEKHKCEIAEKDRIIEQMRREMERMKASLLTDGLMMMVTDSPYGTNPAARSSQTTSNHVDSIVAVEEATSFQSED